MEKILICGDREWRDYPFIKAVISLAKDKWGDKLIIVQGKARGADSLAEKAAKALQLETRGYRARWDLYGNDAGPKRNREQHDKENPDLVIAFHDNIVESKGTLNMINYSALKGTPTIVMFHGKQVKQDYRWWSNPSYEELLPWT